MSEAEIPPWKRRKNVIVKVNLQDSVHSFCLRRPHKVRRPISGKYRGGARCLHPPPQICLCFSTLCTWCMIDAEIWHTDTALDFIYGYTASKHTTNGFANLIQPANHLFSCLDKAGEMVYDKTLLSSDVEFYPYA